MDGLGLSFVDPSKVSYFHMRYCGIGGLASIALHSHGFFSSSHRVSFDCAMHPSSGSSNLFS